MVPYTSGKMWSARLIFILFWQCVWIYIYCNKYQNFNKFQTQSYQFTSHIAAFLCGFDHRDAWNLHTNIIWSKRSTDFKELSPCSVWYPLKNNCKIKFKCGVLCTIVFLFCSFYFGHCVVCPLSIYGFWLPLWYPPTFLVIMVNSNMMSFFR